MKLCKKCVIEKPLSEFNRDSGRKDGYRSICKSCAVIYNKRWQSEKSEEAKLAWREASRKYQAKPETILRRKLKRHNLTEDQYLKLIYQQKGACAICKQILETPCVDHDHACCRSLGSCGECIRGLLCYQCNIGLGGFKDQIEILLNAIEYLKIRAR